MIRHDCGTNLKEIIDYSRKHPTEKISVEYLRTSKDDLLLGLAKPGKGTMINGVITREKKRALKRAPLYDIAAVAGENDEVTDKKFGENTIEAQVEQFLKKEGRHSDIGGGKEWYYMGTSKEETSTTEEVMSKTFYETLYRIYDDQSLGKDLLINTEKWIAYQYEACVKIDTFWNQNDNDGCFYLLVKPRGGKNAIALKVVVDFFDKTLLPTSTFKVVRFLSLWPSTFAGLINTANQFEEFHDKFVFVDTAIPNWNKNLVKEKINILLCSMQSLGIGEEFLGEEFVDGKLETLAKIPAQINILDECDNGLRTSRAKKILQALTTIKSLWMSGSDLYALAYLATSENSYVYDISKEVKLIEEGKLHGVSKIIKYATTLKPDVYDGLPDDILKGGDVSRRMEVIMVTNIDFDDRGAYKPKKDSNGLWRHNDKIIRFINLGNVRELFSRHFGINQNDLRVTPLSLGVSHGVGYLPSVAAVYAFANMLTECFPQLGLRVAVAYEMGSPKDIEANTNAWIAQTKQPDNKEFYGQKTLFLSVRKMLRGATINGWQYELKFENNREWRTNYQMDLRVQSGSDEFAYVFDCNPLRAIEVTFKHCWNAMALSSKLTNEDTVKTACQIMHAQPIFLQEEGSWEQPRKLDYNTLVEKIQTHITAQHFQPRFLDVSEFEFDQGLYEALQKVEPAKGSSHFTVDEPSHNPGKTGKRSSKKQDREMNAERDFYSRVETICQYLPLLVYLTEGKFLSLTQLANETPIHLGEMWAKAVNIDWAVFQLIAQTKRPTLDSIIIAYALKVQKEQVDFTEFQGLFSKPSKGIVGVPESIALIMVNA